MVDRASEMLQGIAGRYQWLCFNLVIEILMVDRYFSRCERFTVAWFQSRNRDSYGWSINFTASTTPQNMFQSRNRDSYGWSVRIHRETTENFASLAFQSRNRDSYGWSKELPIITDAEFTMFQSRNRDSYGWSRDTCSVNIAYWVSIS